MEKWSSLSLSRLGIDLDALAALSEHDRELAEQELLEIERAFRANPLLGYEPHAKQIEFHSPPFPPLRAFFGGNRSGKTTATVVDSIIQAIDRDLVPDHLKRFKRWEPPFHCRFVTPDLSMTLDGVLMERLRQHAPQEAFRGGTWDRAFNKQLRLLSFKNGSWFQFCSNDQDANKMGGAALHRVVYDEEPAERIRNECMTRLIDFNGEELFGMTPLDGMSFTFDEIYDPWQSGKLDPADGRVVLVDMDDNPHLDPEGKRRALAKYKPLEREARKTGRFVSFAGLIYPEFSRLKHVLPDLAELPRGVECFEGIDPGQRHMAAVLFCYLDADDRLTVYDEIAMQGKTVADVCKRIHQVRTKWNVQPRWTVIDPASRNKSHQTGRSDQQEYADHGVMTIAGQNSVSAGINRVKERLQTEGRLVVCAGCEELLGEFRRYRWSKSSRTEDESKEAPVKRDDHLLDVLRYVVMQRPMLPDRELVSQTLTMKDRLLRHSLERLRRPKLIDHPSGPGIYQ
jgi:phage terminase large subunit-like protein